MFWLLVGLLALLFAYLGAIKSKYKYIFRVLLIITLAIPISFGGTTSADHEGYARNYNYMSTRSVGELVKDYDFVGSAISQREETYEIGFTTLIISINKLGFTEAAFFLIIALVTSTLYVSVFYRFRLNPLIILIFLTTVYYSHQANLVRQMIAVTIFLYSTKFLVKQDIWKYLLLVVLAASFHSSAFLLFLFTPLYMVRKESNLFWLLLLIVWIITVPLALHIINFDFFSLMPSVLNFTVSVQEAQRVGAEINFDLVYNTFVLLFFVLRKNVPEEYLKYAALFVIGGILLNISQQMALIYRFALYFAPLMCALIPNLTDVKSKKLRPSLLVLRGVVIVYYAYVFLSSMVLSQNPPFTKDMYSISDLFM